MLAVLLLQERYIWLYNMYGYADMHCYAGLRSCHTEVGSAGSSSSARLLLSRIC
jgi:hypothetical protein